MSINVLKTIFTFASAVSILCSCKKYHYQKIECLDFDSYEAMAEELIFQYSMNNNDEYLTFDIAIDGFEASYHLSGKNISDDLIMNGTDIPDGKIVLDNISPFIINKSDDEEFAVSFSNFKASSINNLKWVIVDCYESFDINQSNYQKIGSQEIDRNRFYFKKISYTPVTYALVNEDDERLLWVTSSNSEEGFEQHKALIENKYKEAVNAL